MLASATIVVAACTAITTAVAVLASPSRGTTEQLRQLFDIMAAALFLGAGVVRLSRWRVTGDARSLYMGAALVVLGGLALPLTSVAGAVMGDDDSSLFRAMTALSATLVTLALVVRALNAGPQIGHARPVERVLLAAGGLVGAAFVALLVTYLVDPTLLTSTRIPPPMIRGALLSIAWFSVGLEAAMRAPEQPWAGKVAPLMGCMAVAELLRVISVVHVGAWSVTSAALVAVVAAVAAHSALLDLDEAVRAERSKLETVSSALNTVQLDVNQQSARRGELVHDARNALAGLRAALVALEEYGAELDAATKDRLRRAALGEVGHLEHLIIRDDRDDTTDFQLDPVLRTVVETRRAMGARIELDDSHLQAHGRPGDVATVLQNLLVNAQRHARSAVRVSAHRVGDQVEILVADTGPGMTGAQVATLFQRGSRGPGSGGNGLGLHVSHALMQQQGGDLQLRSHTGGCVFAMVLCADAEGRHRVLPFQRRVRDVWPQHSATRGD
jgi:signal transduction histidine kinase